MATKKNTSVPKSILSKTTQWSNTKTTSTPSLKTVAQNVIGFFQPQNTIKSTTPVTASTSTTSSGQTKNTLPTTMRTRDTNKDTGQSFTETSNVSDTIWAPPEGVKIGGVIYQGVDPRYEQGGKVFDYETKQWRTQTKQEQVKQFYKEFPDALATKQSAGDMARLSEEERRANQFLGTDLPREVAGYYGQLSEREARANAWRMRPRLTARQMGRGQRGYLPPLQRKQYVVRYGRQVQKQKAFELADVQAQRALVANYEAQARARTTSDLQNINKDRARINSWIQTNKELRSQYQNRINARRR
jgi:alpha-acetolactate decarboxylase